MCVCVCVCVKFGHTTENLLSFECCVCSVNVKSDGLAHVDGAEWKLTFNNPGMYGAV